MDWKPKGCISSESEPTKPTEPGFEGFVGATPAECPKIYYEPEPDSTELERASGVLKRAGVRIMELDGVTVVGMWSDLDRPEVRAALRTFGSDHLLVRYLDGSGIPTRYKLRRVDGDPVSTEVLRAMEQATEEPWRIREQILNELRHVPPPRPNRRFGYQKQSSIHRTSSTLPPRSLARA
jgi:hypothetical protein